MSATSSSLTVTFSTGTATPKDTTIIVKDYLTEAVISGASITISGPDYSASVVSGSDGSVHLGTLQPGTYTLVATATGYQDSDKDILANDSFTI